MSKKSVIPRVVDNTMMSTYATCPRECKLSLLEGWRKKEKAQALSYGGFWHRLLETHYKSGGSEIAVLQTYEDYQHEVPNNPGEYRTAPRAFLDYKRYRKEYDIEDDCAQTLGAPHNPMVEISTAVRSEVLGHEYAGKIDRIIDDNGLLLIEDHKTTSRLDKHYFTQYEMSNQMKGYVWLANQLVPDRWVGGVRINLAHVLTNKTTFHRQVITFTRGAIAEWERNAAMWLRRIEESIEQDFFPAHFGDNGCRRLYGRCQFFDVCKANESMRQAVLEEDFHIDPWDPMADDD